MNMDLIEGLQSRRTVYRFTKRSIDQTVLMRCLESARWAPNHKLTEPWRFLVAGKQTRTKLGQVAEIIAREKAGNIPEPELKALVAKQISKVADVPGLVVITNRLSPQDAFREREDYAASVCALHNLVLALWAEGIGAQWSTGRMTRHPDALSILGINPENEECIGFLKVGYPETVPDTRRRPLDEVVQYLD
jgi:nitroreductase